MCGYICKHISDLQVYSCTQRDVIICLHENGNLSVYACRGLALAADPSLHPSHLLRKPSKESSDIHADNSCTYVLVATAASSRRPKQVHHVNFSVDQMNELNIVVASIDGRFQVTLSNICKMFISLLIVFTLWFDVL